MEILQHLCSCDTPSQWPTALQKVRNGLCMSLFPLMSSCLGRRKLQMKLSGFSSVSPTPQAMLPGPLLQVGERALVHRHVKPFPSIIMVKAKGEAPLLWNSKGGEPWEGREALLTPQRGWMGWGKWIRCVFACCGPFGASCKERLRAQAGTHRRLQEPASSAPVIIPPRKNSSQHWEP